MLSWIWLNIGQKNEIVVSFVYAGKEKLQAKRSN